MLPKTAVAATALALAGSASAKIGNIYVPSTVAPSKGFDVIVQNVNHIINNEQFAAAVGQLPSGGSTDSLGNLIGSFYLGHEFSQTLGNSTHSVPATERTIQSGPGKLIFQVFSAYGVSWGPVIEPYTVDVTFGDENSDDLVAVF